MFSEDVLIEICDPMAKGATRRALGDARYKWDYLQFLTLYAEFPKACVEHLVEKVKFYLKEIMVPNSPKDKIDGMVFLDVLVAFCAQVPQVVDILRHAGFKVPLVKPENIETVPLQTREILEKVAQLLDMNAEHFDIFMNMSSSLKNQNKANSLKDVLSLRQI